MPLKYNRLSQSIMESIYGRFMASQLAFNELFSSTLMLLYLFSLYECILNTFLSLFIIHYQVFIILCPFYESFMRYY